MKKVHKTNRLVWKVSNILCLSIFITLLLVFGTMFLLQYYQETSDFIKSISYKTFSKVENKWFETTYEQCKNKTTGFDKISCVNDVVFFNFEYNTTKTPYQTLNEDFQGDCESSTMFYMNVLERFNITTRPAYSEGHVFVVANWEEGYCILDQYQMMCVETGGESGNHNE